MTKLLDSYGYIFLFIIVGGESLGIPLPGETVLVAAAALAALGHFDIRIVITVAIAAAIAGDSGGYWIGFRGGTALVERWGRLLRINQSHIDRAHLFFARHGGKTVFLGRFVAILRTWAAVLAGVARMPYRAFLIYNVTGAIAWACLFGTLGYQFGRNLPKLDLLIDQARTAVVLTAIFIVALLIVMRWFLRNRDALALRASAALQRVVTSERFQRYEAAHPRLLRFASDRFARGEYLGLHLTIGLVIIVAAIWLFGGITEDVIHHDQLTQLDALIFQQLRGHATQLGDQLMLMVSLAGNPIVTADVAIATWIVLAVRRNWIVLGGWSIAFAGGAVLDWALKAIIQRPRPPGASRFLHRLSYSFPSEHAMGSLICYGMLAYLLLTFWAKRKATRLLIIVASVIIIAAVGFSRLYLGVHYFSDVIGGYAAGAVWLAACISGVEIARRQPQVSGD